MHPELIKANLRIKGSSLAAIARELGVTTVTVSKTVMGARSKRIERRVAEILDLPLREVFPSRYKQTTKGR